MNRQYLLDSLDGFKGLVFRLLPIEVAGSLACVPMTTDAPRSDAEKRAFETAVGIPSERTYWAPGGFDNVPAASNPRARAEWVHAVAAIKEPHLFLDPDTGFYDRHTGGGSAKTVLVGELAAMLATRESVIVYRHQYWPKPKLGDAPNEACPYVWHGLRMLWNAGLYAFAYQSQAASLFFVSLRHSGIEPFETGFQHAMAGLSSGCVVIGGARGPDTLDQTTVAIQRIEDASTALALVESTKYSSSLLNYALDRLPDEFLPTAETYQESRFGRRPPLTPEQGGRIKMWYGLLAGARSSRGANTEIERALSLSIEGLVARSHFRGVMLYSAYEDICEVLGGRDQARDKLDFSVEDRRRIERARRPIAHCGEKAKNHPERALPELQAEATESFRRLLSSFLRWAAQTNPYSHGSIANTNARQPLAGDAPIAERS